MSSIVAVMKQKKNRIKTSIDNVLNGGWFFRQFKVKLTCPISGFLCVSLQNQLRFSCSWTQSKHYKRILTIFFVSMSVSSCKELNHIKWRKTCVKSLFSFKFDVIAFSYLKLISCDQQPWNTSSREKTHNHLNRDMTKPTKWVYAQRRLRSAWARPVWSESSHTQ